MQKVCNSEDSGLNDALKLARRVENDGVVASAALELSGSWATTGTASRRRTALSFSAADCARSAGIKFSRLRRQPVSKGSALSQPASF